MKKFSGLLFTIIVLSFLSIEVNAQVESSLLSFNRGKLWQSVFNGKIASSFSNWKRVGIGLDWPGFDPATIAENLGGAPSYMVSGGFLVGAKRTNDSVFVVEDWSIAGGTVSTEPGAKYIITKHSKIFDKSNYWLATDPTKGEEVIETVWEYNVNHPDTFGIKTQLPIRVTRTAHQWSGNKREENYIIYQYTFKNISNEIKARLTTSGDINRIQYVVDTLSDFYATLNYAMHTNSRAWTVLFPNEPSGAKNSYFAYDAANKTIFGRASDYLNTTAIEKDFGFSNSQGLLLDKGLGGEYLSPGYVGLKLLFASKNKNNQTSTIGTYGWSAGDNSFDFSGPLADKSTELAQYEVVKDVSQAPRFIRTPSDSLMRRSRLWSMMSLGPWDLAPGDSIVIAVAEMVDGVDYKMAVDSSSGSLIGSQGLRIFQSTLKKAQFTYDNNFNHPDPPAAPTFKVDYYKERDRFVANLVTFSDEKDNFADPDDGIQDLVGYKIYRSSHLPIGPWDSVGTVYKKDPKNYDQLKGMYSFVDSTVVIGSSYYYALTAFDSGRVNWNIKPSATFEETGSTKRVPPLETSIYANKTTTKFISTLPATNKIDDIVVVPNPFIIGQGRSQLGEKDRIQFINIPNPCTIRIYTVRGDLVKTLNIQDGTGAIASWDQTTDYGQYVESGVFIFHCESGVGTKTGKFSIIR